MDAMDRVKEIQKQAIFPRLGKGAAVLGELHREGQKCLSGWGRICPCPRPTEFCQAKLKWIKLLEEYYDGIPFGLAGHEKFYVVEAMTASQFRQSGLTAIVEIPVGPFLEMKETIRIGARGTTWKTLVDLADLQDDDAALAVGIDAVVKIQKVEFAK